jgi:ABC-type sugar transport system ATPase subunit
VSSEIAEIVRLSHRVMVMREGRIAAILDRAQMSQERILAVALGVETQS